jgi:hypothetical protein
MFGYRVKFRSPFVFGRVYYVVEVNYEYGTIEAKYPNLSDALQYSEELIKEYHGIGIDAEANVVKFIDGEFDSVICESSTRIQRVLVVNRKVK